ncbi:MAG: hypothetical protein CMO80_06925 [Verrucomicrobiales bacterium]|nr:hypothetical protein [Verrucomicrobiales bacterium]
MARFLKLLCLATFIVRAMQLAAVEYNRDVRPILADHCFNCHGPDANARKAGLRLDTSGGAYAKRDDGAAIVPGKALASLLIKRIFAAGPDDRMPPPEHPLQLNDQQKNTLREWIDEGAKYEGHWAFVELSLSDSRQAGAIDRFISRSLKQQKLPASSLARKETQLRRASLDLTGLPPTLKETDALHGDESEQAYERAVDRLLDSDRFGERMAMWWLDGARYADSHGFQADWERYQWPWRDWVIQAFNENKPFDQFTIEQLAGDMLPNARPDQIVATGFNRNHRINTEGGSIDAEWLVENVIDRVETMGSVWLGLTLGCARCHDHKYDPISQKEFYQLFAFFHNVAEKGKGPGKQGNFEPTLKLKTAKHEQALAKLDDDIKQAKAELKQLESRMSEFITKLAAQISDSTKNSKKTWKLLSDAKVVSKGGKTFTQQPDGSFLASGKNPSQDVYTFEADLDLPALGSVMLEAIPDKSMKGGAFARSVNGNCVLTDVIAEVGNGKKLEFVSARATYSQKSFGVNGAIDGKSSTGWALDGHLHKLRRQAAFGLDVPVVKPDKLKLQLHFKSKYSRHAIERFRIFVSELTRAPLEGASPFSPQLKEALASTKRTAAQKKLIQKHIREKQPEFIKANKKLKSLNARKASTESKIPTVMVLREMEKPRDTFILNRGQYDQPGEKVVATFPSAFPQPEKGTPNNRLGLAQWIVSPRNPLTARVQVNRLWELFFGVGLVKSSENFGTQADMPSHPELLDWLAAEFIRTDWDLKGLVKTIVTSDAYRRSSVTDDKTRRLDPDNRWLARGPRFRVQAEIVRDQSLYLAGLLKEKLGGPGVYPYQPAGIWSEFNFYGNMRNYRHAKDEGLYRRSLYTIWKRTAAPPGMTLFDMPNREICTVKRSRTNTPLQALALMNDVTYVEASRYFAERMMKHADSHQDRIAHGFRLATSRQPSSEELSVLTQGFERRLRHFESNDEAVKQLLDHGETKPSGTVNPAQLAAMTTTASILLNLDETLTR